MKIREVDKNKKQFISLLLLADEQENMLFCSDQRRSDSEAVLSVGLFVLHKFLEFC